MKVTYNPIATMLRGAFIGMGLLVVVLYAVVLILHVELLTRPVVMGISGLFLSLLAVYAFISIKWARKARAMSIESFDVARRQYFLESPIPMWVFDLETLKFLEVNSAAIELYGYSREEFMNMRITEIRPTEDRVRLEQHIAKGLDEYESLKNWKHRTKDGQVLRVGINGHATTYQGRKARLVAIYDFTEVYESREEYKKQGRFLNNILRSLEDPVWVVDRDFKLLDANPAFYKALDQLYGYPMKEGDSVLFDKAPKKFQDLWRTRYMAALKGRPLHFDFRAGERGSSRTLRGYINPAFDDEGKVDYLVCSSSDVTDYVRLKEENEEALKRYELISQTTNDILWEVDPAARVIKWGPGLETRFGYTERETSFEWWAERVHPEDRKRAATSLDDFIAGDGRYWREQYRLADADGNYKWVIDHGYAMRDEDGEAYSMVGAVQDISELLNFQEQISKLSLVASETTNGVIITDANNRIEWVNEAFAELTGYTLDEVQGIRPGDLLFGKNTDPDEVERMRDQISKGLPVTAEVAHYTKQGKEIWLEVSITPVREDGQITHYVAIQTDVSNRRRFINLMKKKNKELRDIAVLMAHDLRRPVANLLGLGELVGSSIEQQQDEETNEIMTRFMASLTELDQSIRGAIDSVHKVETEKV